VQFYHACTCFFNPMSFISMRLHAFESFFSGPYLIYQKTAAQYNQFIARICLAL